ncbi:MAG: hypothetical protein D3926_16040 [Desulfobacteraceae bacterium]|nr:MAG: hypothetical protein D3926_16040 [Desulfobacteraceae bacterium]
MLFDDYLKKAQTLRTGVVKGYKRPHKPAMLLAILSLIENGKLNENKIAYSPLLLELFKRYFEIVKSQEDSFNPILPFFHLRGDQLIHHKPFPGKEDAYEAIRTPRSTKQFLDIVSYAYLEEELFSSLRDPEKLNKLRQTIIETYFRKHEIRIKQIIEDEKDITTYQTKLEGNPGKVGEKIERTQSRSTAFSRIIREIYDYRCAACGLRINLNGLFIIDAARLIPFSISKDDDPCNGIALCKNHHWAMDKFLLVPGIDDLWHVSPELDDRLEGCSDIIKLDKRKILLPQLKKYHPKEESLAWREKRILK